MATTKKKGQRAKKLVIVESPTKARTVGKFLGRGYAVARLGRPHPRPAARNRLGVEVEDDFRPRYVIPEKKKDVVKALRADARDGRARSTWRPTPTARARRSPGTSSRRSNLKRQARSSGSSSTRSPRTRSSEAFQHPRADRPRSWSTPSRPAAILDRLVGYKISPLLWRKVQQRPLGRAGAVGRGAADRRPRARDRGVRAVGVLDDRGRPGEAGRRPRPRAARPSSGRRCTRSRGERVELHDGERGPRPSSPTSRAPATRSREVQPARAHAQPGRAVHHQHAAAGGVAQARLHGQAHDGGRPAALRGHAARQRGHGRPDHLHAHRLGQRGRVGAGRGARLHRRAATAPELLPAEPRVYKTQARKGAQEAHEAIRPTAADARTRRRSSAHLTADQLGSTG